jgi:hypothetical protein
MKLKLSSLNFAVLIFIVVIAVIVLTDDMTKSILIILLLVNVLTTCSKEKAFITLEKPVEPKPVVAANVVPVATNVIPVENPQPPAPSSLDLYGMFYDKWNNQRSSYTKSYNEPMPRVSTSCAERNYDVDSANTLLWQKRTHDKQRNDGWAAKSSDYFAYHYADELDIEENKRWWGRDEF